MFDHEYLNYSQQLKNLTNHIKECEAIIIGAGSGLSSAAGLTYSGERFNKYFSDFINKYHLTDMYSAGFYPYESLEEYWAYWSRHIYYNRYIDAPKDTYQKLLQLVKDKDYFVLTTNVDHQFQKAGFDKKRLFYTQGDYGLWQCSKPCHQKTYDNKEIVEKMLLQQKDLKIPSSLIPYCPKCGAFMTMNLRCDQTFVQDEGWYQGQFRYNDFINKHRDLKIIYLELGVGQNTPVIIKYPFWNYTNSNKKATYVCINYGESFCPDEIKKQAILINGDIDQVINDLLLELEG
ncbi:MAG TPA: Sir2 silent information regulator family NAD-dependent deacetylase [Candidatus Erysipelatoclostridium merdavium]|uniref:Sir2 silent information regulator family NAD-dependent deacetylase n=1 Tax=Candidatus Erysipelatoclostridium merdavium TaxID=2838566 RepID=A0A9D1XKQ9_9FIRM|nr:Sir2 silent information regulator family NAD-dependent deacetylase [Candidatus Erysipelatoclostridium merdavium]